MNPTPCGRVARFLPVFLVVLLLLGTGAGVWAAEPRAYEKSMYPPEDSPEGLPPNVLLLLDVGSPMTFTPEGTMPQRGDSNTPEQRVRMLKDCTYGSGARPYAGQDGNEVAWGGFRYGRDLDNGNNRIGDPDCYYTPYDGTYPENGVEGADKPNKPYFLTFRSGDYHVSLPSGVRVGDVVTGYPGSPYDKQPFKPSEEIYGQLVPNDSRLYIMKLVLWRLTSPENADLFSRMSVAMGTSYQEDNYPHEMYADFYKAPNWGIKEDFPYGGAPDWATGLEDNYGAAQRAWCGINRNFYSSNDVRRWRQVNRAVLKVPFDRFYDDAQKATPHLTAFRRYIDGIENPYDSTTDNNNNTRWNPEWNPELFADGKTPLATSIEARVHHQGMEDPKKEYLIRYHGADTVDYGGTYLKLREGQAAGSVIDFFSPLPGSGRTNGLKFETATEGFFPVTGPCQPNWLIVFTAGNDATDAGYTAADAALNLYKKTLKMRGRRWDKGQGRWVEQEHDMRQGVRTLVVGFVDPTAPKAEALREDLRKVAAAGQPRKDASGNWAPSTGDPSIQPFFANNATELLKALTNAFRQVDSDAKASGAPLIQGDPAGGENGLIFGASYEPRRYDVWEAKFQCSSLDVKTGKTEGPLWEAGRLMQARGSGRNLWAWRGSALAKLSTLDAAGLSLTGDAQSYAEGFKRWLTLGYSSGEKPRIPLGDMQHSNFIPVPKDKTVYIQTNRGFLHALDMDTGQERWGFVPPNVLSRLRSMKFNSSLNWAWYGGDGKTTPRAIALNLLDGLMTSRNVSFQDNAEHRVMIGTLGRGGCGLYAMDVTSSDAGPKMLWAVDNSSYNGGTFQRRLTAWGGLNAANAEDYEHLGLTFQAAAFTKLKDGSFLCLLPGGVGLSLGEDPQDKQGRVLFALEPETGRVKKKWSELSSGESLGMAVAPITYMERGGGLEEFFTADSEGRVLHCKTEGQVASWGLKSPFRLVTVTPKQDVAAAADQGVLPGQGVAISKALCVVKTRTGRWLFGGTGDLEAPDLNGGNYRTRVNPQQFLFGLKLEPGMTGLKTGDLREWTYFKDNLTPAYSRVEFSEEEEEKHLVQAGDKGWYLRLRPTMTESGDSSRGWGAEFMTTSPYLFGGSLIVTTFIPKLASTSCDIGMGDSKLYMFDPETGKSDFDGKEYGATNKGHSLTFHNVRFTGITAVGDRVYLGVRQLESGATKAAADSLRNSGVDANSSQDGTLLNFKKKMKVSNVKLPFELGSYIRYWRETISGDAVAY